MFTSTEEDILRILLSTAPEPVTIPHLARETGRTLASLRTHITNIRNKLDAAGSDARIDTAYGEGWFIPAASLPTIRHLLAD